MDNQRLFLYTALGLVSFLIYLTWIQTYHPPTPPAVIESVGTDGQAINPVDSQVGDAGASNAAGDLPVNAGTATSTAVTPEVARSEQFVTVKTDVLDISLSSIGGTLSKVDLIDYPVSIDQQDVPFSLINNEPLDLLVAESGLQSRQGVAAPTHKEPMAAEQNSYTVGEGGTAQVPFTWKSESGVVVTKTYTFKADGYVIDVDYTIDNQSTEPYVVNQYRQLKRKPGTKDEKQQFVNTYIGAVVSNTEDVYNKVDFGDIEDENFNEDVTNGWVAMIEHYFATAWVPDENEKNSAYSLFVDNSNPADFDHYVIGMVSGSQTIAPGAQGTFHSTLYAGPKIQDNLSEVAENLELTVDFGFLTIIAQPLFWLLKTIHGFVGNWGWAIVLTVLVIKALLYKLSEAAYKSMARMKKLQPKMAQLKERHGDDRAAMGQATMELYKKEKVNPLGGCLPMLVQMPIFIGLYWALLESVELRQAPWILWIEDLSIRDPYFILPVLMAAAMFFQQKLNPAPVDPIQAKVMQFLPLIFGVFFALFPAGLVLYWVVNNILSIAQQWYITRVVIGDN